MIETENGSWNTGRREPISIRTDCEWGYPTPHKDDFKDYIRVDVKEPGKDWVRVK